MVKDKPTTFASPLPPWRQRRSLLVIAVICLLYLSIASPFAHHNESAHPLFPQHVDWSQYAYSQYATDQHYLCNSLMVFDQLEKLGSKADRLLFYPNTWDLDISSSTDRTSQLLVMARDRYHVKLKPVEMYTLKRQSLGDRETWDASINKLHAWNHREYNRIIHLDSDTALLKPIDELFFLPLPHGSPVAMPRAYWRLDDPEYHGDDHKLTSLLIVLEPSSQEADVLWDMAAGLDNSSYTTLDPSHLFDMELLNTRYLDTALILPHRPYALVTGEFRRPGRKNHTRYLGNTYEEWDPQRALSEAKLVHFSDWPLPKPHIMWPNNLLVEMQPQCEIDPGTASERGCESRQIWKGLYDDFRRRRKDICRLLSVPAPEWPLKVKNKQKSKMIEGASVGIMKV